jgi:hypothetical protein
MYTLLRVITCLCILLSPLTAPLLAQVAAPHVGYVYPAGGRQGATFQVKIGGEYLDGAPGVRVSGKGVQAKILGQTRPLTLREIDAMRARLEGLHKKKEKTDADRKEIETLRKKLVPPAVQPTPALPRS